MNLPGRDLLRHHSRRAAALIAAAVLAVLSGGAASNNSTTGTGQPRAVGTLGPGFVDRAAPPPPEGVLKPRAGSWDHVHRPRGYRVVLLTAGRDSATTTLVRAVRRWATAESVSLTPVVVTEPDGMVDGIVDAIAMKPDLIITAGRELVDALALVTASHLDRQFLVIGAQLPEPTVNVTAAIWRGASSRGHEVPDTPTSFDPDAYTQDRADAAIRAGVASVLNDLTGIVISLD